MQCDSFIYPQCAVGRSLDDDFCRVVEVNALAQRALWRLTQGLWVEHSTFQLRGGNSATALSPDRKLFGEPTCVASLQNLRNTCCVNYAIF